MAKKRYQNVAARWATLYRRGASLEELAELSGATRLTIANYLRQYGIALRRRGPRDTVSKKRILLAYKEYQSGASLAEIGENMGVSKQAVQQWFVRLDLPRRSR